MCRTPFQSAWEYKTIKNVDRATCGSPTLLTTIKDG
jgi:hypothetical protein